MVKGKDELEDIYDKIAEEKFETHAPRDNAKNNTVDFLTLFKDTKKEQEDLNTATNLFEKFKESKF